MNAKQGWATRVIHAYAPSVRVIPRFTTRRIVQLATMSVAPNTTVLLRLRWVQLCRAFPSFGIVLLALSILGAVTLIRKAVLSDASYAAYIAGGAVLMVWGMHQRRSDHRFLQHHVPRARLAMAMEYGALLLPPLIGLVLGGAYTSAAALPLALALPWTPMARASGTRGSWLRRRIPAHLFEWKSLVQSTHPWGLLLWLAALGCCWLPVLPLMLLGAIALMATGAQEQCEPRTMLLATARDARSFLRKKTIGSLRLQLFIELPVLIAATLFQPDWWWIHALLGMGLLVLVVYAVILKYANYHPNLRLDANGANVGVAAVFAILPGLCVVPMIMLLTEVPKARANLNAYFHAHDH